MEKLIIDGTQYTIEFGGPDVNRWQKYGKDRLYLRKGEAIDLQSEDSLQASHSNVKNGMWQCDSIVENHKLVGRRTWHGSSFVEVRWSAVVEETPVVSEEKEEDKNMDENNMEIGHAAIGYYDDEKEEWVTVEVEINLSDPDYPQNEEEVLADASKAR